MEAPRFWRGQLDRYNILLAVCERCGAVFFDHAHVCPDCREKRMIVRNVAAKVAEQKRDPEDNQGSLTGGK